MNKREIENRGIDQGIFDLMCSIEELSPSFRTFGFRFMYLGEGVAGIKMYPAPGYSSFAGRANGGIIAALADNVMGMAGTTLGQVVRTVEMSLNYFAPVFEETELIAEAYVVNPGNTLVMAEARIINHQGKLVAKSKGTFIRDIKTRFSIDSLQQES